VASPEKNLAMAVMAVDQGS